MTKFNNTDIRNGLMVNLEDIYIFPVSDAVYSYLEKIWSSFVNKMVALTFPNDENIFDHAVFEVIQGLDTKIVASSTHFKMKELIGNQLNKDIQDFISKTRAIPLNDESKKLYLIFLYFFAQNRDLPFDRLQGQLYIQSHRREYEAVKLDLFFDLLLISFA